MFPNSIMNPNKIHVIAKAKIRFDVENLLEEKKRLIANGSDSKIIDEINRRITVKLKDYLKILD